MKPRQRRDFFAALPPLGALPLLGALLLLVALPLGTGLPLLLTGPTALHAQQLQRESQIPLAPEGGILEITPEVRARLGLFPEATGFRMARLFLWEDGTTVLELEIVRDGRLERQRRVLTMAELADFRAQLSLALAAAPATTAFDRDGRGGLVLGQTLLGLGFYGWAVPYALDLDSAQGVVAAYLLTAGASFAIPYQFTRGRAVTESHRDLTLYGGTRGILFGVLAADAFVDPDGNDPGRGRVTGGIVGSAAGSLLGFMAADRYRPDEGRSALWAAMGDFGLAAGAASAYVAGPYDRRDVERGDGEFIYVESEIRNRAVGHAMTLAGGAAGLVAGRRLGERVPYTEGNVNVLRSAGILGAQAGMTLARATGTDEGRAVVAGGLVGGLAGIVGGDRMLRDKRFTTGEGLLVNAGHLAGGATALGITYLIVEEIDDNPLLYLATSTLGSVLGAGLVYRATGDGSAGPPRLGAAPGSHGGIGSEVASSRPGPRGSAGPAPALDRRSPVTVTLHPENALLSIGSKGRPLPLVTLRF